MMKAVWRRSSLILLALVALAAPAARGDMMEQSPIDIRSEDAVFTSLPELQFDYSDVCSAVHVRNTGSPEEEATIRTSLDPGAGHVTVDGIAYDLLQFHFHTMSEHLINGVRSAMELHFVHQAIDGTLLVVGRLINVGAFNAVLDPIFSNLPQNPGDEVTVNDFELASLLPGNLQSFRYDGSLTTDPYTEGVKWNVLAESLEMSQAQIDAFRLLFPHGNSREVEPLNGRVLLTDVRGFAVPEPSSLALAGVGLALGGMAWLRRRAAR